MASIGIQGAPIASIPIASIPIASIPIASIPIASIPIASIAVAGSPIASIPIASIAVAGSPIASIPIASIPVASIPAVADCVGYACASKTLGEAAADQRILPSATLADLGPAVLATLTLGQLGPFFPPEITLADVLALIAGPASNRNYEQLPFTELPAQDWRSAGATQTYKVRFTLSGGVYPSVATVQVVLPPGFRYGGRASFLNIPIEGPGTPSTPAPPKASGNTLSFHLDDIAPGNESVLELDLRPSLVLGASGPVTATVTPDGSAAASASGADVEVRDPSGVSEDGPPTLGSDTIHFSYITSATDTDTFRIPAPPAGSHVTVKLVPPAAPTTTSRSTARRGRACSPLRSHRSRSTASPFPTRACR